MAEPTTDTTMEATSETPKLRLLNPREVRRDSEIEVDLGDGTMVRARKLDMTLLVFEGQLSMTMLVAVQRMVDMPDASPVDRVNALGGEGKSMVELLRKHASVVCVQPKIVLEETADPNVIPASYLNIQQLMAIWNATAVVPTFGAREAARFRSGAREDDAPPAPVSEDVPSPAVELVVGDRLVEYIGQ